MCLSLLCKIKKGTGEMVENTCPLEIRKHPPHITKSSNRLKGRITTALLKIAEKLLLIHNTNTEQFKKKYMFSSRIASLTIVVCYTQRGC